MYFFIYMRAFQFYNLSSIQQSKSELTYDSFLGTLCYLPDTIQLVTFKNWG